MGSRFSMRFCNSLTPSGRSLSRQNIRLFWIFCSEPHHDFKHIKQPQAHGPEQHFITLPAPLFIYLNRFIALWNIRPCGLLHNRKKLFTLSSHFSIWESFPNFKGLIISDEPCHLKVQMNVQHSGY